MNNRNKRFKPGLKIKAKNNDCKVKRKGTPKFVQNIIKWCKINCNKEKPNNKEKSYNKEDLTIIPYKEDSNKEVVERSIVFQNPYKIKDIFLLITNCITYHCPRRIEKFIEKVYDIKQKKNINRQKKCFVRINSIKRNYNEFIKDDPNKEVQLKIETNANYMYFIIITLLNGKSYIFNPFRNMTFKHFSDKGEDSFLYKLYLESSDTFRYYIDLMFKKDSNEEFNEEFIYSNFNMYKLDLNNIKDIKSSDLHIDIFYNILTNIRKQMNEGSNFSETTEDDSNYKSCTSQENFNSSYISDSNYKSCISQENFNSSYISDSNYKSCISQENFNSSYKFESNDNDYSRISPRNDIISIISAIPEIDSNDFSEYFEIEDINPSTISKIKKFIKNYENDYMFTQNSHTSIMSNNNTSFNELLNCSFDSIVNGGSITDYPESITNMNNDILNLNEDENKNSLVSNLDSNQIITTNKKRISYQSQEENTNVYKKIRKSNN